MKKFIASFFLALFLFGCTSASRTKSEQKTILLVSIPPYKSIVEQIAGDQFQIITVVPPSADPHTYEPTARQLTEIAEGRLWFQIGEPFEQKLGALLPKTESLDLRKGLDMIHHSGASHSCCMGEMDRHIWLSPKMVASQIDTIANALSERYPAQKEQFMTRKELLHTQLLKLNQEIELRLHNSAAKSFLISHPAFAYFCREYGCEQLSVEQEGKEPRPKELEQLLASAISSGAKIAIAIPQHNNKGAQLIADKLKIPVRVVDPYAYDCIETMRMLASLIENPYLVDKTL